jgi:hypothetical protein
LKRGLAFLFVAVALWAFQAASVHVLIGRDVIALLLSPGAHSSFYGLGVGVVFIASRLAAVVAAPALALVGVADIALSYVRRPAG